MSLDVDRIASVVEGARGTTDELMAIIEGLTPLATQSPSSHAIFDHDDVQIRIGMRGQFTQMVERLRSIEAMRLSPAPIVAGEFSADESVVLVVKYWACPGEQRLPFDSAPDPGDAAMRRFRDDLLKLADAGWMHPYATRGTLSWRVSSTTGMVVLDNWFVMKPIEDKANVVAMLSGIV
jgi:hypothetical protein